MLNKTCVYSIIIFGNMVSENIKNNNYNNKRERKKKLAD
jgi:hypothetical protein